MRRVLVCAAVLTTLVGCRGFAGPEPPNEKLYARLGDPYARVSPGAAPLDEARALLDDVGKKLGYGKTPGDWLAKNAATHAGMRLVDFITSDGGERVKAAWTDLLEGVTGGFGVDAETKRLARMAEARILDFERDDPPETTMRAAYLAEIAWVLLLLERAAGHEAQR